MRAGWGWMAVVIAVSACQAELRVAPGSQVASPRSRPAATPSAPQAPNPRAEDDKAAVAGRVPVSGALRIPKLSLGAGVRLVSDRGAGLVSNNAGGLVSNNAGGIATRYRLAAIDSSLVEGARVFLADSAGSPIPGLEAVKTDAQGRFEMPQVPPEMTFVVVAEVPTTSGKPAVFRTLVKVGKLGATTSVDAATTLVTVNVLEGLPGGELGEHNPAKFQAAAQATADKLTNETLPDFTSLTAVKAAMEKLLQEVAELKSLLGEVKSELQAIRQSLDAIKAAQERTPAPTPAASASVASSPPASAPASVAPSAAPSVASSVTPSVVPSPVASVAQNPAAACLTAINRIVIPSNEVGSVELRSAAGDTPFASSPTLLRVGVGGGSYMGPLPGGCPVWIQYYTFSGVPLGAPYKYTLPPMGIPAPVSLPPPGAQP